MKPFNLSQHITRSALNLQDFGAHCNGVDDDKPAWDAIFAKYPNGGVAVEWTGYCRINAPIAPPAGCANIELRPNGFSPFYNPDHGFDFIKLTAANAGFILNRVRCLTDHGGGSTACFFLNNASDQLIAHDFWGRNCYHGIQLQGSQGALSGRTYLNGMKPSLGAGLIVDTQPNEVTTVADVWFENAPGQNAYAGVLVFSCSSLIIGGSVAKCGHGILLNPGAGKNIATLGFWPYFNGDTGSGHGAWFAGAGAIQRIEGNLRVSSNGADGLAVDNPPRSAELWLRAVQNTGYGIALNKTGTQYNSRYRGAAYGNTISGFSAIDGCTNFSVDLQTGSGDDFGGNGQYGGVITTGCDHFDMNIRGTGDTLGLFYNGSGTSATKVITSRN